MKNNELSLNDLAVSALKSSAKWCMFLSIVGFVFIGLMLIGGAFLSFAMAAIPDTPAYGGGMGMNPFGNFKAYLGMIYVVMALIYFFPVYYLYNYAKGTKQALDSGNEETLARGLESLKSHHKFLGILTIIMLVIYVIAIITMVAFAASYASSGM